MLSMSVAQLPSVESPSKALADVREHFAADSVYSLSAPYHIADLTLGSGASNLVVVQLPNAGTAGTAYRQTLGAIGEYCWLSTMLTALSHALRLSPLNGLSVQLS